MPLEGAFPEVCASVLRMKNASHSRSKKPTGLARVQGYVGISAVARQMRGLIGLCGGVTRQDVSAAADADANSNGDDDFAAWVAYRKAKKKGARGRVEEGEQKKVKK